MQEAQRTGLSWSEVASALGLAAKAVAVAVPVADEREREARVAFAAKRLSEAFSIEVKTATSKPFGTRSPHAH